jgi:hypothetical protein
MDGFVGSSIIHVDTLIHSLTHTTYTPTLSHIQSDLHPRLVHVHLAHAILWENPQGAI